jgi:paraquat-inducible protein B
VNNIDSHVDPVTADIGETLAAVKSSFEEAESLLVQAQTLISENSKLRQEIIITLESMSDASRSVEALGDYLQRHPESLITGKK